MGLQKCEWVVFHGSVDQALPLLDALDGAGGADRTRALWLKAVALGACGRYGEALDLLTQIEPNSPEYSMSMSLRASLLRQIGCHDLAQQADREALAKAATPGSAVEALTGLAADAVGLQDVEAADAALTQAGDLLRRLLEAGDSAAAWWRHEVRLEWVRCEVALMQSQPGQAEQHAHRALQIAEQANAPRHVAKSLLFLAVAHIDQGQQDLARSELNRSILLTSAMGCLAVAWPAHAVLAALIRGTDPQRARPHFQEAARITGFIAGGLPADLAARWTSRTDIAALAVAAR